MLAQLHNVTDGGEHKSISSCHYMETWKFTRDSMRPHLYSAYCIVHQ